ncbi:MAG TPA: hypothetical protein VFV10_14675 [Gammaproteobacteria bacterium]|nr:hypothetical protein [Gammaproteobacteria bacterium]
MIEPLQRPKTQPTAASNEALNAPLFSSIIQQIDPEQRCVILDLGPARTETCALFGQFRCRLEIADLGDSLTFLNGEPEPEILWKKADFVLPKKRREPADLILCWDLLNYLDRPALAAIMGRVAERGRTGTLAHALIVYSSKKMTPSPGCFVPVDAQRLMKANPDPETRDAPRYSPEDLAKFMPAYTVERGRLLRNGMQEFLFRVR